MMTFRIRLKKVRKPNHLKLRFDLEKLRDPDVACIFKQPLIRLRDEDMDINTMITTYNINVNKAMSDTWERTSQNKAVGH